MIVGVQATAARMSQEAVAAQDMLTRFAQWQGRELSSVAADTTYGNGEFLQFPTTLLLHLHPVVMPVLTTSLRDWYPHTEAFRCGVIGQMLCFDYIQAEKETFVNLVTD